MALHSFIIILVSGIIKKLEVDDILSPLADKKHWESYSMIGCNVRSERMGWLPSAPQFEENPLEITKQAEKADMELRIILFSNSNLKT
ncbi:hypothetical protein HUE58_03445 [Candidatus Ruthia endofausta]|uniref:Uncharacterized protein n=1 Tax=Candidatus Ruthia endofausta TaxID=2738852 RepID=A0A6N0HPI9_9GAMM|nr:hypothetical protein HUE58_03445 [Candidatus Ruthia endofausta]